MNTYQLEALAPLVFRSGKPFGAQAGADGANFPMPSSAAGLLRTLHADRQALDFADASVQAQLKALASQGPLLAQRTAQGDITPLLPRPADALYLRDAITGQHEVFRLQPMSIPDEAGCDLPPGLLPVGSLTALKGKPADGPQFWPAPLLEVWQMGQAVSFTDLQQQGLERLPSEQRSHVALDDESRAADAGKLFQTSGLDLAPLRQDGKPGWNTYDLVFLSRSAAEISPGLATFGGERRLSRIDRVSGPAWPEASAALRQALGKASGLRLTLATPAIFSQGYLPGWIDANTLQGTPPGCAGLQLQLRAAAVERWQPVSGWDLVAHKPKAMRKAVAAGAVYWFDIIAGNAASLLDALWLQALSDHEQDRRDGFGLVLPAPWNL